MRSCYMPSDILLTQNIFVVQLLFISLVQAAKNNLQVYKLYRDLQKAICLLLLAISYNTTRCARKMHFLSHKAISGFLVIQDAMKHQLFLASQFIPVLLVRQLCIASRCLTASQALAISYNTTRCAINLGVQLVYLQVLQNQQPIDKHYL